MSITELQKTVWENLAYESTATQKIRNTALEYYIEYRQHLKQTHSFIENESKIQNLLLISYFISEKSQVVYDMNGKKMSNIALSINQLAKKHSDYKEFFYHLKEMMRKISLPAEAKQSEEQINSFMKYFSFVMTFYNKFLTTFDKINIGHNISNKDLEILGGQKEYKDKIKYILWIVYICFRKVAFKNNMDTIGNTCLLACLFTYFIQKIYLQQKITSIFASDIVQDLGTFPNQFAEIQKIWLNFFCLKDYKTYESVKEVFLKFIDNLVAKLPELKNPFSPKTIFMNIKRLQQFYHKREKGTIDVRQIDETLFLKNLVSNQQNVRFTAFGAKRKIAKFNSNNAVQCRRVLNYDTEIKNAEEGALNKKQPTQTDQKGGDNFLKVFHNVKSTQTPVILIQATPVNQFATAYNWLYMKSQTYAARQQSLNLEFLLEMQSKSDGYQLGNSYVLQKRKLIEGLFHQLINQYEEKSQEDINVATILALEVFYYVMNITNRQITELVAALNVSWFSVWYGVDMLLNYDKTMPNNVKTHLLLLQTSIVSTLIWKEDQFIDSLEQVDLSQAYQNFFYRILHHIAYQINFIGKTVYLPDILMDQAFIVSQFYLKECSQIMRNVSLDVIIMCSIYGVCRAKNLDIKFKAIMAAFKNVNNIDQKAFQAIQTFEGQEGQTYSIIVFYNQVFLKHCKSILMKIKGDTLQNDQNIISKSYVLSPVKSILPASLHSLGSSLVTPNTSQMLLAYNESPLLRRSRKLNVRQQTSENHNLNGNNHHRRELYNEREVLRQRSNNVSQMIQKKFGNGKASTLVPKAKHSKQG